MADDNKQGGSHESHEKGVETTKEKHGQDFYKQIGHKDGESRGKEEHNDSEES